MLACIDFKQDAPECNAAPAGARGFRERWDQAHGATPRQRGVRVMRRLRSIKEHGFLGLGAERDSGTRAFAKMTELQLRYAISCCRVLAMSLYLIALLARIRARRG